MAVNNKDSFTAQVENIAQDFLKFVSSEFDDFSAGFQEDVEQKVLGLLDKDKPRVMVYGIYNSGKSTLINAMFRREVAEMADRPMTSQIAEYDRGDYYLVDSPGVDAPIEHERVTEAYLQKCHVILFVISSKGMFEDRGNYERLARLIARDVPFVIVLNDRGAQIRANWPAEKKKEAQFAHEQELLQIQHKIIKNLRTVAGSMGIQNIADRYEVVEVNAKKALLGISKNKPLLWENSNVDFLEKRILQLLTKNSSILKVPIRNLSDCFDRLEGMITQSLSGNTSEDFGMRLNVLGKKRDNIMEELRILAGNTVNNRLEELTNAYATGNSDLFMTIANDAFMEVESHYEAKLTELVDYYDRSFRSLNLFIDPRAMVASNLRYDPQMQGVSGYQLTPAEETERGEYAEEGEGKKGFVEGIIEMFKSRKKKEEEKRARLEQQADRRNQIEQDRVEANIRIRQEARQYASVDLDELYRYISKSLAAGMNEKYDEMVREIQEADYLNKQQMEEARRQMTQLRKLRNRLSVVENSLA